jgi:sulfotransferase family protein
MAGIIWLASYPKSGSTWLRSFLHNFLSDPDRSYDINKLTDLTAGESMTALYRAQDPSLDAHYTDERVRELRPLVHRAIARNSPQGVLVKTHNALVADEGHPLISLDLTAGAIYIVRNPLDVAISFSHHNRTTVDNIIEFMNTSSAATKSNEMNVYECYDTWSGHVASWTETPSPTLHVLRYEDMLAHPHRTFAAVAKFLGIEAPRQRIEKAIRLSSFQVLKEQERRQGFRERPARMEAFFRAGKAGQWKKELTEEQVAAIVSAHREQMARFGYVPEGM